MKLCAVRNHKVATSLFQIRMEWNGNEKLFQVGIEVVLIDIGNNFRVDRGRVSQCEWEMFLCRDGKYIPVKWETFSCGSGKSFSMCMGNIFSRDGKLIQLGWATWPCGKWKCFHSECWNCN